MHDLVKIRVRPYYIYQCDLSEGIGHFRAPVSKGLEIIEGLRDIRLVMQYQHSLLMHQEEAVKLRFNQTI